MKANGDSCPGVNGTCDGNCLLQLIFQGTLEALQKLGMNGQQLQKWVVTAATSMLGLNKQIVALKNQDVWVCAVRSSSILEISKSMYYMIPHILYITFRIRYAMALHAMGTNTICMA